MAIGGKHKKTFVLESIKLFETHRKEGNLHYVRGISKGSLFKRAWGEFQTLYAEMATMYCESLAISKY